jgi:hypothetical protein
MAVITHPLFSISASGSVGHIVYNNSSGKQTARVRSFRRVPLASAAQTTCRNNCRLAAIAWAGLDEQTREEWATRGLKLRYVSDAENLTTLHNGWTLWLGEWCLQQATPSRYPLIPT